ncbi:stage II sporulation protein R [Paenibacillus sp. NPDC058071]|uniref:stage II sporulation protein R n=1 Tax=Paenibacillus sp. NPDC058071 TaxID=3346326 RepID=UPI0036DA162E
MSRNYSRFSFRRSHGFILFVLVMLIMSWELQRTDAALASGQIPEESIRLRILANSDSPADQAVKRVVRDAIVDVMEDWASGPQTIEQARTTINSHMSEIEKLVEDVLQSRGFEYSYKAELGLVPFPTKLYGNEVYPAGNYEALLITLGEGQGQNWWCVLFPPLCFVDAVTGEAAPADAERNDKAATVSESGKTPAKAVKANKADKSSDQTKSEQTVHKAEKAESQAKAAVADKTDNGSAAKAPEAKFFLGEMLQKVWHWLKGLFA